MDNVNGIPPANIHELFEKRSFYFNKVHCFNFEEVIDKILELCDLKNNDGEIVIDLGGGTGILSNAIHNNFGKKVIIADISHSMLLQNSNHDINKVAADGQYIPFKNNSVDVVVCRQAIHYMDNINKVIDEIKRVLKKEGKFIVAQMTSYSDVDYAYWKELLKLRNPYRKHFFSGNDLERILMENFSSNIEKHIIAMEQSLNNWSKTILVNHSKIQENFDNAPSYYRNLHNFKDLEDDLLFTTYWTILKVLNR